MSILALDIGATKIAIALLDSQLNIHKRAILASQGTQDLAKDLEVALQSFILEDVTHIGVAAAGPINVVEGTISPINIAQWRDFPIAQFLQEIFPGMTVALLGDCTALALAEYTIGAGVGHPHMLGVVVSTGIGGGLVIDGEVHQGESGNAALIGHHTISFDSPRICECGRRGCLEEFARGPKMVEAAIGQGWREGNDFQALAQSATNNDPLAIKAIDDGARALASGLINAMMIADVHTVVIGGGVSFAGDIYLKPLRTYLHEQATLTGFLGDITILAAHLGPDSGVIGAAIYAQTNSHQFKPIQTN